MRRRIYTDTSVIGGCLEAVQLMRDLREKLSREMEDMSYEAEKEYIRKRVRLKSTSSRDDSSETAA